MEKTRIPLIQRITGICLVVTGFIAIFVIFNPKGLIGPPISNHIAWVLIFYAIGAMISLGSYLAAGYSPAKGMEILAIAGLWIVLILPVFYLPISEDTLVLVLGFSPFLALLLWIGYTKLKEKLTGKRENQKW